MCAARFFFCLAALTLGWRQLQRFNVLNKKDSNLSIGQIFARQLMCISGVSSKKAAGIVQAFPTPCALMDA